MIEWGEPVYVTKSQKETIDFGERAISKPCPGKPGLWWWASEKPKRALKCG